jgi:TRAP-type uncharacterized transport system substrate-binding protein
MKKLIFTSLAALFLALPAHAQNIKLTLECGSPDGATCTGGKHLAEVAAAAKVAAIQVSGGKVLTRSVRQVAEGKTDMAGSPLILPFLLSKGLGPYSGVGKKKGAELAKNLRILYGYHVASFYLIAFKSKGINSWDDLKGKTIFNGPPRGGALTIGRAVIKFMTGMSEGKGYTGKQVSWGSAHSLFLDGGVDAAVRPGNDPPPFLPLFSSAGAVNVISYPLAKWNNPGFQKFVNGPGNKPKVFPIKSVNWGKGVNVISEDNMMRTLVNTSGDAVNKNMPKALAKKLTAAFIKSIPDLNRKAPWIKSALYGETDDKKMGFCAVGMKFHPGAIEAFEEAGRKIPACAKP